MVCSSKLVGIELESVRRTTYFAVSQFEGVTTDNRPVHVRLRHGELTVRMGLSGGTIDDAICSHPIFDEDYGDDHEFDIGWPEIEQATGLRCVGAVEDYMER